MLRLFLTKPTTLWQLKVMVNNNFNTTMLSCVYSYHKSTAYVLDIVKLRLLTVKDHTTSVAFTFKLDENLSGRSYSVHHGESVHVSCRNMLKSMKRTARGGEGVVM